VAGVRSRSIKGRNAAGFAEVVLGDGGIKGIGLQRFCALEEFKLLRGDNKVKESFFLADGAVTGEDGKVFDPNLKLNGTAVAAPAKTLGEGRRKRFVHSRRALRR
jgi:hypothetical protein